MKFAPIVPIPMLQEYVTDYHMILAPMCQNHEDYGHFYQEVPGWKILDNGAAEGNPVSSDTLLGWAQLLEVDEVIAPDVMHDMEATADMLITFVRMAEPVHVKVMAVMQATNWSEFDCIVDVALTLDVASLALPKLLCSHMGGMARVAGAEMIREKTDKPIHCLGASTHLNEVKDLARQGIVRGIDTAAPVVLGLQKQLVKGAHYDWALSHKAVDDYWNCIPTEEVISNLATFKRWCEDTPHFI